jgi:hypothetical protein
VGAPPVTGQPFHWPDPVAIAIPVFVALIVIELVAVRMSWRGDYDWRDTGTSLAMGLGNTITGAALPAEAFNLASDQMPKVWRLLTNKYGMAARLFVLYDGMRALLRMKPSAGVVVHLSAQ